MTMIVPVYQAGFPIERRYRGRPKGLVRDFKSYTLPEGSVWGVIMSGDSFFDIDPRVCPVGSFHPDRQGGIRWVGEGRLIQAPPAD